MERLGRSARRLLTVTAALAAVTLATPAAAHDYFFEDFGGPALDAARWDVAHATSGMRWCSWTVWDHHSNDGAWVDVANSADCYGVQQAAPHGTVSLADEGGTTVARFASEWPSVTFPYLFAGPGHPRSPFPPGGDFDLEIRIRYDGLSGHGDGINVTGWADPTPFANNPPSPRGLGVWGIWGDSTIWHPWATWQTYRLEYRAGVYTAFLDGVQQGAPWASEVRPATIWIGNPVVTWWGVSTWSPFTLDYVRVTVPHVDAAVDVKPSDCPNLLDVRASGAFPVAIVGTPGVGAASIDPASIRVEGVAPLSSKLEDVATPALPLLGKSQADCNVAGPDGVADLVLKLDATAVAKALGTGVVNGEPRTLRLTGALKDGTPIAGEDVVLIVKP